MTKPSSPPSSCTSPTPSDPNSSVSDWADSPTPTRPSQSPSNSRSSSKPPTRKPMKKIGCSLSSPQTSSNSPTKQHPTGHYSISSITSSATSSTFNCSLTSTAKSLRRTSIWLITPFNFLLALPDHNHFLLRTILGSRRCFRRPRAQLRDSLSSAAAFIGTMK